MYNFFHHDPFSFHHGILALSEDHKTTDGCFFLFSLYPFYFYAGERGCWLSGELAPLIWSVNLLTCTMACITERDVMDERVSDRQTTTSIVLGGLDDDIITGGVYWRIYQFGLCTMMGSLYVRDGKNMYR